MSKKNHRRRPDHDSLVMRLYNELRQVKDYDRFWKFMKYNRNGQVGEVDLLMMFRNTYEFYEIKTTCSHRSKKIAQNQFDRYKLAFPEQHVLGYWYYGEKIHSLT